MAPLFIKLMKTEQPQNSLKDLKRKQMHYTSTGQNQGSP